MKKKLTAGQVAAWLHLNKQTVYKFAREGRIPCQRIGLRPVLFDQEEVEQFLRDTNGKGKSEGKESGLTKTALS